MRSRQPFIVRRDSGLCSAPRYTSYGSGVEGAGTLRSGTAGMLIKPDHTMNLQSKGARIFADPTSTSTRNLTDRRIASEKLVPRVENVASVPSQGHEWPN